MTFHLHYNFIFLIGLPNKCTHNCTWLCKSNIIIVLSLLHSGTPLGTPQGTPVGTPRGSRDTGGDSSDTLSETDSQKSLRMRRKLPSIPSHQEAISLPSSKRRYVPVKDKETSHVGGGQGLTSGCYAIEEELMLYSSIVTTL